MERVRRWWKPDALASASDANGNVFLPPMTVTPATVWELGERMAEAMDAPVMVLVTDGSEHTYRELEREGDLERMERAEGVRLMAGPGLSLHDGMLSSDGSVGMNFDFPAGRAGNASVFGSVVKAEPYRAALDELVAWLVERGRYRWGWLPLLRVAGALLVSLLLAGLVAAVVLALDGPLPWLSVPFVGVTGAAATWGLAVGVQNVATRERGRLRSVVVTGSR